jgi:protein-serine/threonine kinase
VIKCAQYSYAIDWWALGCIIVEGIVGRVSGYYQSGSIADHQVPFRLHSDEPPVSYKETGSPQLTKQELLWDRILLDSWRDVFYDAKVAEKSLEEYLLDDGTLDFIDSVSCQWPPDCYDS